MKRLRWGCWFVCCVLSASCAAGVGVQNKTLPADAAQTCQSQCATLGLHLSSVVTVADNVGCVCSVAPPAMAPTAQASDAATAAAAGAIVVTLQQQAQQRRSQANSQATTPR